MRVMKREERREREKVREKERERETNLTEAALDEKPRGVAVRTHLLTLIHKYKYGIGFKIKIK